MQLGELVDRNFGSSQCGSGAKKTPEAEAFCTFAHNILTPHGQKLRVFGHRIDINGLTPLLEVWGCSLSGVHGHAPVQGPGDFTPKDESFSLHK